MSGLWLHLAENDDGGNPQGWATAAAFRVDGEPDTLLHVEGLRVVVRALPFMRGLLQLGRIRLSFSGYGEWVGNMAWNAYLVGPHAAAKTANYLAGRGWQLDHGWDWICDIWDERPLSRARRFAPADFEHATQGSEP